jgi:hypothetical protein
VTAVDRGELFIYLAPMNHLEKPPEAPPTLARKNSRGLIEIIDVLTGRILCVQTSHYDLMKTKFDRLTRIDTPQGPVFIEKGINFDVIGFLDVVPYSRLLGNLICQSIVNGKTKIEAFKDLNLEYATVKKWEQDHEEFRLALKQAEKDRADNLAEEALEVARASGDAKKHVDTLLEVAAIGDPDKFGKKTKISGDASAPLQFIVGTGILRKGDPGYTAPDKPPELQEAREVTPIATGVEEYVGKTD